MVRGGGHRSGMSPLIATVLLMAFAVALGGMIMNWKFDVNVNSDCERLREHVKVTQLCVRDSGILLRLQADAESPSLQGIKLSIFTKNIENVVNVKNAALDGGGRLDLNIPVLITPDEDNVDLIGIVGPAAEPFVCTDLPIARAEPIKPC